MKLSKEDIIVSVLVMLMSSTPIAFMSFDFMFPNISTPSLEKNLLLLFIVSILIGAPSGYFIRRTSVAMMTVILYVALGYALAVVMYSTPYSLYDIDLVLPSFYYTLFFRYTIVLLFLYVLGGFIGVVFGQIVKDSIRREQTKLTWSDEKG